METIRRGDLIKFRDGRGIATGYASAIRFGMLDEVAEVFVVWRFNDVYDREARGRWVNAEDILTGELVGA